MKDSYCTRVILAALVAIPLSGCPERTAKPEECKTVQVACPDGPAFRSTCPEKLYEDYARKSEITAKAGIDILGKVKLTGLDVSVKDDIALIVQQLNQYSTRARDILKFVANDSNNHPCDEASRKRFQDLILKMNDESAAIAKLEANVTNSLKGGSFSGSPVDKTALKTALKTYKSEAKSNVDEILKMPTN